MSPGSQVAIAGNTTTSTSASAWMARKISEELKIVAMLIDAGATPRM